MSEWVVVPPIEASSRDDEGLRWRILAVRLPDPDELERVEAAPTWALALALDEPAFLMTVELADLKLEADP